jgi:hypothetical protein
MRTVSCDVFRLSENEMHERFKKTVKQRIHDSILAFEGDTDNLIDFDESSIQSLKMPLEESFLSEIKDFNVSTSMIFGKTSDLDISSSFIQIQKPIENMLAAFPKYMPFKKNEPDLLVDYKTKIFDVS